MLIMFTTGPGAGVGSHVANLCMQLDEPAMELEDEDDDPDQVCAEVWGCTNLEDQVCDEHGWQLIINRW